jgi:hypothetical protein
MPNLQTDSAPTDTGERPDYTTFLRVAVPRVGT